MSKEVLVVGAGGHAKVVIDVLRSSGWQVRAVFDDNVHRHGSPFHDAVVAGATADVAGYAAQHGLQYFIVAIGANDARLKIAAQLEAQGLQAVTAVHPSAVLAPSVRIEAGTVVMPGACINADTRIGHHVIINTRASVDHDCVIGDGVHIGPGSVLCGGVKIGAATLVGAGAALTPGVAVGSQVRVGAGAAVIAPVMDGVTVAGVPARLIERKP
jgi:sugar O-acyltransferase (sialic acid O-acetyltransferase NeuD family)